jgi:hypothetical protein
MLRNPDSVSWVAAPQTSTQHVRNRLPLQSPRHVPEKHIISTIDDYRTRQDDRCPRCKLPLESGSSHLCKSRARTQKGKPAAETQAGTPAVMVSGTCRVTENLRMVEQAVERDPVACATLERSSQMFDASQEGARFRYGT